MKYKTTDREQRQNNNTVIGFGYCEIQNLERYLTPNAYTCGIYGWRADFYEFDGFTISTGYQPLTYYFAKLNKKRGLFIKAEILKLEKKLEKKAYKFQQNGDWNKAHKEINKKIEKIYKKAVQTIIND